MDTIGSGLVELLAAFPEGQDYYHTKEADFVIIDKRMYLLDTNNPLNDAPDEKVMFAYPVPGKFKKPHKLKMPLKK